MFVSSLSARCVSRPPRSWRDDDSEALLGNAPKPGAIATKREHIESVIRAARTDLDLVTARKGSPHALVCTKNQSTYERRARQHRTDLDTIAQMARARAT